MNEAKKHHYIPQFVLRNFINDNGTLTYWNVERQELQERNPSNIYMVENLYRDEKNYPNDPTTIEKKFSRLEKEASDIIKDKILNKKKIVLTRKENEKLRKYLFLLTYRSDTRKEQYIKEKFDDETKEHLLKFTIDGDFVDLWLREIDMILDSKNYQDINTNPKISNVIKQDAETHLLGYYMTFVSTRGQDIILSDIYPTAGIIPTNIEGANIYAHYIYPIDPSTVLILNHVMFGKHRPQNISLINQVSSLSSFSGNLVEPPKSKRVFKNSYNENDQYTYSVGNVYEKDVIKFSSRN